MEKVIKYLASFITGAVIGAGAMGLHQKKVKEPDKGTSPYRFEVGFHLFNKWIKIKNEGRTLEAYFHDNEIATVAIYGVGALGERLFEDLRKIDIEVKYAIDRIADTKYIEGLKIVGIEDELKDVDVIIVTPVQDYYAIEELLEHKTDVDIVSLEDIIDYCC